MIQDSARLVLLVNLAATLYMTGLIWFVQLVHYPLFAQVGEAESTAYAAQHQARTTIAVAPMLVEAAAALALVFLRPAGCPPWAAYTGLALVGLLWISTAFVQVPLHGRLSLGYDAAAIASLVATNWVRTALWTARAALVLWLAGQQFAPRT